MGVLRYVIRPRIMPNYLTKHVIYDTQQMRELPRRHANKRAAEKRADALNASHNKSIREVKYDEPAAPIRQYKD